VSNQINKISILGAGNGGCAFSGHLAMKGFEVVLYEDQKFEKNLEGIKEQGGINLIGAVEGFGKISLLTTNPEEAVQGADIIMVVTPAFAQMIMMQAVLPYLEDDQIVVFIPDNFGALRFVKLLKENKIKKRIKIAGTVSLLYATRRIGPGKSKISGVKEILPVGVLPAIDTEEVLEKLKRCYTEFKPSKNILEASFGNTNMIAHCGPAVLNAGWIEYTKGDFDFYIDGMTKSVCRVMEKIDKERIRVGEKLGLNLLPATEMLKRFYKLKGETMYDLIHTNDEVHKGSGAPPNLRNRYISEDVPYGLVPVSSFGNLVGIDTPIINAVIELASTLNAYDYRKNGATPANIGLGKINISDILEYVNEGKLNN